MIGVDSCPVVGLDFDEIRRNAQSQGIVLSQIAIVYDGLNDDQLEFLNFNGLLVNDLGNGRATGRFARNGEVFFAEMAVQVLYLGA